MLRDTGQNINIPEQLPDNACLFLDVDGTLIDLAATPESVIVPAGLVQDLTNAEGVFGGALAIVSGRSIAEIDRLFAPKVMIASGVHGAEFRASLRSDGRWSNTTPLPARVWDELSDLLDAFPGTLAENKVFSYAVHYRAVPESGSRLRTSLDRFLSQHADVGLQVLPGHCVFELKRPGVDKGVAIRALMQRPPFAGRIPIFVGDDVTDAPGFTAVKALGGYAYSVDKAFPNADGVFSGPSAVRAWLSAIGRREAKTA